MGRRTNRRQFIKETAAAGIGFWVAGGIALGADSKSPNQKLNIACIGVGGKGSSDTDQAGNHGNIVALCDVDSGILNQKARSFRRLPSLLTFARCSTRSAQDRRRHRQHARTIRTPPPQSWRMKNEASTSTARSR